MKTLRICQKILARNVFKIQAFCATAFDLKLPCLFLLNAQKANFAKKKKKQLNIGVIFPRPGNKYDFWVSFDAEIRMAVALGW